MRFLEKFLHEKIKPHFEKGGKFEKLYPVYDGFETFLFVPGHTAHKGAHIRDGIDLKRTMITVVLALIPCLLFGIWNTGHQHFLFNGEISPEDAWNVMLWDKILYGAMKVLPIVIVSYAVGLGVEFAFCIVKKHSIQEGFLVSGMLIPLILPVDIPLWMVAVATVFAVIFGKEVFGGTGMNILNVALTARAFLFFAYPTKMSGDQVWVSGLPDATTGETQLGMWAQTIGVKDNPEAVQGIMDKTYSTMEMFIGNMPGSIGETSAVACLIGALILIYTGIGSFRIMASVLAGGLAMSYIFNLVGVNPFMEVSPIDQILAGGFLFGLVFMATDPVTASQTPTGKIIYGFFIGFFAIMIRVFNPAYPEGMMLAILFMNVMAPLIDHYVLQANVKKRMNRLKQVKVAA
jgi:Na+-transporting NADH:ubiquinone oxidoreductase subunit B